jgi:protein involved in polysaccharide export with SLBB domain
MRLALISLLFLPAAAFANPLDFSDGLTGLSADPAARAAAASSADPARAAALKAAEEAAAAALNAPAAATNVAPGQLAPGDKVRMTVFGEDDMSGEFEIDSTGSLAVPLVGEVQARGLTARELEKRVAAKLNEGYLVNARVNIEVLNFRPFFILGEVQKPGSYPWANDMTVINAVALGGGYTPRAKVGNVTLRRANDPERNEVTVSEETKIFPGDVIRVEERFF